MVLVPVWSSASNSFGPGRLLKTPDKPNPWSVRLRPLISTNNVQLGRRTGTYYTKPHSHCNTKLPCVPHNLYPISSRVHQTPLASPPPSYPLQTPRPNSERGREREGRSVSVVAPGGAAVPEKVLRGPLTRLPVPPDGTSDPDLARGVEPVGVRTKGSPLPVDKGQGPEGDGPRVGLTETVGPGSRLRFVGDPWRLERKRNGGEGWGSRETSVWGPSPHGGSRGRSGPSSGNFFTGSPRGPSGREGVCGTPGVRGGVWDPLGRGRHKTRMVSHRVLGQHSPNLGTDPSGTETRGSCGSVEGEGVAALLEAERVPVPLPLRSLPLLGHTEALAGPGLDACRRPL